ncbi:META domain-containing protein [Negadavirga shengliensis]|uniref:META domain-containing protein n=1 Tax=Negadavirga shengliensis TaxID=1389218 RepID=A0ABV9SY53_9BACT
MKSYVSLFSLIFVALFIFSCESEPVDLSDHDWKVINLTGTSAPKEKLEGLTLEFKEGQEIGGFAGCNDYRGGATYNREQIKFSTLYTDGDNCEDMNVERTFLSNLESSSTYTYRARKLVFYDDSGNILVEMERE